MRRIFRGLLFLAFSLAMGCGQKQDTTLTIVVAPDTSFILPGDDDPGCYTSTITGPRIFFPSFNISWQADDKFYPSIIKITFTSSDLTGGQYSCTISDGLTTKFETATAHPSPVENGYFTKGSYQLTTGCPVECGGITPTDASKPFKITGQIKLIGYSISSDNEETPYTATSTVFMQNVP